MPDDRLGGDMLHAGAGIRGGVKKHSYLLGGLVLGSLLVAPGANSSAASLGRVSGATILGRPLDIAIPVQLAAAEDLSSVCVSAEVFFGDNELSSGQVLATVSQGARAGEAVVRIRTSDPVDEPVVMLNVHEGCHQRNVRKYTLLPEMPQGGAVAAMVSQVSGVPGVDAGRARPAPAAHPGSGKILRVKPQIRSSARGAGTGARGAFKSAPDLAHESRARLKLEPIELAAGLDPVLKSSPELLSQPSADMQQRAIAAALWHALNLTPQDVALDTRRLKSLEADAAGLLVKSRTGDLAAAELRRQLAQARQERYGNWLVYALCGALFLALLALAALFFCGAHGGLYARHFSRRHWWGGSAGDKRAADETSESDAEFFGLKRSQSEGAGQPSQPEPSEAPAQAMAVEPPQQTGFACGLNDLEGVSHMTHVEELDVEQHADFFLLLSHPANAKDTHLDLDLTQACPAEPAEGPEFARDVNSQGGIPRRVHAEELLGDGPQADIPPLPDPSRGTEGAVQAGAAEALDGSTVICNLDGHGMPRIVTAEELDVQRLADSLLSVGQLDKAVQVLRTHIAGSEDPSMLVYQELFDLYYSLGRREDYDTLRKEFLQVFNIQAPSFGNYATGTHGREFYAAALARTESLWPKLPQA